VSPCSVNWCLAEGGGNGDQHLPLYETCGSGRTLRQFCATTLVAGNIASAAATTINPYHANTTDRQTDISQSHSTKSLDGDDVIGYFTTSEILSVREAENCFLYIIDASDYKLICETTLFVRQRLHNGTASGQTDGRL